MSNPMAWRSTALQAIFRRSARTRQVQTSPQTFQQICRARYQAPHSQSYTTEAPRRVKSSTSSNSAKGTAQIDPESVLNKQPGGNARGDSPPVQQTSNKQGQTTARQRDINMVKKLMRTVIHPVAIVTAADTKTGMLYGATISSFHTVSFDPDPIISLNLRADSITLKTILATGRLTISFPTNDFSGIELAHAFTKGNSPSPLVSQGGMLAGRYRIRVPVQYPPAVYNHWRRHRSSNSGLAFALTADLTGHLRAGDHYVLTATLTPGQHLVTENYPRVRDDSEIPYFSAVQSLAYVHGKYTDRADDRFSTSFDKLSRLEDPIMSDLEIPELSSVRLRDALEYYRQRIDTITRALTMRHSFLGVPEAITDDLRNTLILHIPEAELVLILKSHRERVKSCQTELSKRRRYRFFDDQERLINTKTEHDELTPSQLHWIAQLVPRSEDRITVVEDEIKSSWKSDGWEMMNYASYRTAQLRALSPSDATLIFDEVRALKAKGVVRVHTETGRGKDRSIDAPVPVMDEIDDEHFILVDDLDTEPHEQQQRMIEFASETESELESDFSNDTETSTPTKEPTQHTQGHHDPDTDELVLDLGEGDVKLNPDDLFILKRPGEKNRIDRKLAEFTDGG